VIAGLVAVETAGPVEDGSFNELAGHHIHLSVGRRCGGGDGPPAGALEGGSRALRFYRVDSRAVFGTVISDALQPIFLR
jgi:hypothetical protein